MEDEFYTLLEVSTGLYKEKGSRFLAFAYPVKDEDRIREILDQLRKEYHDARHHCYAWRLGHEKTHFRANDDGEPSNSAGKPILGQIQSFDLSDVLIVVVRYFGGTLLGVGGLIQAYKSAAQDAIRNNTIVKTFVMDHFRLSFAYPSMNEVMKVVKVFDLEQSEQHFEIECTMVISVRRSLSPQVLEMLEKVEGCRVDELPDK